MSLDNLGCGDADHQLLLILPDEMQASTVTNIVPPSSFLALNINQDQVINDSKEVIGGQGLARNCLP